MRWSDILVHVIDFEGSVRSGIVEYGVVTLRHGAIENVATRLCRPVAKLAPAEIAVHGLAEAALAKAAPFADEWTHFSGLRETGLFAAHFSATEHALLRAVWPCPRLSPDFLEPGRETADWGPWIDTGRLAAERLPGPAGLEHVVAALGLADNLACEADAWCPPERRTFHCAPFDALACALVLQALARDEEGLAWSVAQALAASTADPRRREERRQARLF